MGWVYGGAATALGALFVWFTIALYRQPDTRNAMRVFGWSITYVTLLFGAMALDVFVEVPL